MKRQFIALAITLFSMQITRQAVAQTSPSSASDPVLESKRKEIDSLDQRLFEVLGARERVVKEIGIYKAQKHIPSLQAARFQKVLDKGIEAGKKEGLSETFVTELLNAIHKESLRIEDALKK
ncbi:MAG TPA: chorismate mutase [Puia sp.]|jgi:chorismate mutase